MDWRKSGWPENRQAFAKFRYIRLDAAFSKSPQTISRGLPERRKFVIKLARIRQNNLPEQEMRARNVVHGVAYDKQERSP